MNCNENQSQCTRKFDKDPRRGCPKCEFTVQYKDYRKELERELANLPGTDDEKKRWNSKMLLRTVAEIGHHARMYKTKGPKWTILTAILVSVYRDEESKIKAIEQYSMQQQLEAQIEQMKSGSKGFIDTDEGDFT